MQQKKRKNTKFSKVSNVQNAKSGNAQNREMVFVQNVKFRKHSNIYKVMTNIMIEKTKKTYYANSVKRGICPTHNKIILMEE